jgi:predicted kinase
VAKLIFFCGKMAAGKSTLARELAAREDAVLLAQDELVEHLFPGEIVDIPTFITYSTRLKNALTPIIHGILRRNVAVVLDFPGNTKRQRAWFRQLIDQTSAAHELHVIEASDDLCKQQLRERSRELPPGAPWTSDAEFDMITAHFDPPADAEGFNVIRHQRG